MQLGISSHVCIRGSHLESVMLPFGVRCFLSQDYVAVSTTKLLALRSLIVIVRLLRLLISFLTHEAEVIALGMGFGCAISIIK